MWIPPDWMVWTYIGLMVLITAVSVVVANAENKLDEIKSTDILGMIAGIAILYDWLSDHMARPPIVLFLLLAIYTLANADALLRGIQAETFDSEEERQETFVFTALFVALLSLPLYYLGAVMMSVR
jgi:phage shock protein PspC (stress-responsive transcriptional regulator)